LFGISYLVLRISSTISDQRRGTIQGYAEGYDMPYH
jgi:hypothetical protein